MWNGKTVFIRVVFGMIKFNFKDFWLPKLMRISIHLLTVKKMCINYAISLKRIMTLIHVTWFSSPIKINRFVLWMPLMVRKKFNIFGYCRSLCGARGLETILNSQLFGWVEDCHVMKTEHGGIFSLGRGGIDPNLKI